MQSIECLSLIRDLYTHKVPNAGGRQGQVKVKWCNYYYSQVGTRAQRSENENPYTLSTATIEIQPAGVGFEGHSTKLEREKFGVRQLKSTLQRCYVYVHYKCVQIGRGVLALCS